MEDKGDEWQSSRTQEWRHETKLGDKGHKVGPDQPKQAASTTQGAVRNRSYSTRSFFS